jgi:hypothetical protein
MSQKRITQRRKQARQRQTLWLVIGGGMAVALISGAVWWVSRGGVGNSGATPLSRLSTNDFHSLAFSPTKPDTAFFGHHGGLMVSSDGGRIWRPASLQNADAMALAAPPSNPQIMYAAGHDVLVKSTDGGATWQSLTTNLPGTDIHGFAADPQNADHVFANVAGFGIWGSQDGGATWELLSSSAPRSAFNLAVGKTAQTLYVAAGEAALWRSEDGGKTWSPLSGLPGGGAVAVAYDSTTERLYVTTLGNGAGLYVSNDAGATWTALELKGTLLAIALSPQDSKHLLVVDEGGRVYASRDGGITWSGNKHEEVLP